MATHSPSEEIVSPSASEICDAVRHGFLMQRMGADNVEALRGLFRHGPVMFNLTGVPLSGCRNLDELQDAVEHMHPDYREKALQAFQSVAARHR